MQQPPQFNWRCVTLNKWCKNKRWLEASGSGPGEAAYFIGQEPSQPLQGGTGLCTPTAGGPSKDSRGGKDEGIYSTPRNLREDVGESPPGRGSYRLNLQFQYLHMQQIHICSGVSPSRSLSDLVSVNVGGGRRQPPASSLQPIPFPSVIHTWPAVARECVFQYSIRVDITVCFAPVPCMCVRGLVGWLGLTLRAG